MKLQILREWRVLMVVFLGYPVLSSLIHIVLVNYNYNYNYNYN